MTQLKPSAGLYQSTQIEMQNYIGNLDKEKVMRSGWDLKKQPATC